MSDPKEVENEEASLEAEIVEEIESSASDDSPTLEAEPVKKSSKKLPLFILFLLLLAAGYLFAPQPLKDEAISLARSLIQTATTSTPEVAPAPPEQVTEPVIKEPAIEEKPMVEEATEETPIPEVPQVVSASSEEVNRMLGAMSNLETKLNSLGQQQQELKNQQHAIQRMQLRARLRWITNPANHLNQIQLAWEEISLMPLLSAAERQEAAAMLALSEKSLHAVQNWQQVLLRQADTLTVKEHHNIIPTFENRWLNWVAEQFSVRPSLSQQEADNAKLRQSLSQISRDLELEQWPDAKRWLQLRATLQLRLVAAATDDAASAELDLPESFDAVRADIDQLRQHASAWMERLK